MTRRIRSVALVAPGWPPGALPNGIVTATEYLKSGLEMHGVRVHVLALSTNEDLDQSKDVIDVSQLASGLGERLIDAVHSRYPPARLGGARRMARRITSAFTGGSIPPVDILEMEESFGAASLVARSVSTPVVGRLHGPWFLNGAALGVAKDEKFNARVRNEGRVVTDAQAVSCPSRHTLDSTIAHYEEKPRYAGVIPNAYPVAEPKHRWRLDECDSNEILFIGRFDRHKGGDIVIRAFAEIAARHPRVHLTFVGPDRGFIDNGGRIWSLDEFAAAHLPVEVYESRFRWLNTQPREQLVQLRQRAAVTVIASRYENFPYTGLEALAQGCPVVYSNAGGLPEMIRDRVTGIAFGSERPSELAAAVMEALQNPEHAARLGEQAIADCRERFSPHRIAEQMLDFYERVLELKHADSAAGYTVPMG